MLVLLLALLLLPTAPAQAQAQAQWSPPEALGSGFAPRVAVARDGSQQVAWTTAGGAILLNGRRVASGAGWPTGPVSYARRSFAMAWTDRRQRRAHARVGRRTFRVGSGRRVAGLELAGNARGKLALAWFDDRGTRNDEVLVAVRLPGRPFSRPRRVARGSVRSVSVAVGPDGQVLVAWSTRGRVRARMLGGRTETIRSEPAHNARLETAVLDGGAVVGWTAKYRTEGGEAGDTLVQVATRAFEEHRFRRAQRLARHDGPESALRVDTTTGNLAYSTPAGLFHTYLEDGAYALPAVRSAGAGAVLQDLAELHFAYLSGERLYVSGDPVSAVGARDADLATDPETGQPTVVWEQDGRVLMSSRG